MLRRILLSGGVLDACRSRRCAQAMTYFTKLSLVGGEVPLEAAYDWSRARCIMDVGGGRGEMLSRCMAAAGREVRGVLMDRQWVLDR
jgi:2-polyprenyl-3-methyl-5-hydroxy-6-metoxy-1,4-benzoquinol methylase